jgi:hypothetical protein
MAEPTGRKVGRPRKEQSDTDVAEVIIRAADIVDDRGIAGLMSELAEVAELRGMATKDRSYVAAEKLLRTERELRDQIRDLRSAEESQAARDDAVMETELVEALASMPASQLEGALSRLPPGALENALARRAMH